MILELFSNVVYGFIGQRPILIVKTLPDQLYIVAFQTLKFCGNFSQRFASMQNCWKLLRQRIQNAIAPLPTASSGFALHLLLKLFKDINPTRIGLATTII